MPAGIRVFNDFGTLVIDETYQNLCVRTKGAFTVSSGGVGPVTSFSGLTTPVLVIRPTGGHVWHASVGTSGQMFIRGEPGTAVSWWLFDVPAAPYATYGLVVHDASGRVTFDATKQYARLRATISLNTAYPATTGQSYDAGRTYGVAILKAPVVGETIYTQAQGYPPGYYYSHLQRDVVGIIMSGVSLTYTAIRLEGDINTDLNPIQNPKPRSFDSETGSFAIVDVTGY